MGSFWGASFKRTREQQLERLARWAPARKRFLDIGCGVGHYLEMAKEHFEELYGVEPSLTSTLSARQKGFSVVHDYFHAGLSFEAGFDAISIIEVLEHLEQPSEVFAQAAQLLNDNGILLIEVPNGQRIVQERLYYNLCTDHIQYFSVASLTEMARRAGLTIVCAQEALDPNLLELYAKKVPASRDTFDSKRQVALEKLKSKCSTKAKIAAWGAGAESACFLAMIEGSIQLECIFDSDQAKHGHHIVRIPIVKPTAESVQQFDQIILFANSHKQQIQEQLNELGFSGRLLTVETG
ncbi:class I SAM-dependent methyltransferase [Paenibacillus sp. UMB4589-SE434]|uniref:class I SAM-dependent methyltransferase n=1 Tax=Paenibacillus sp. UMB4589-SE434 TaxID=3046314 RepID=UPI00254C63AE|nr:class I SAM-dependent methyltransferase [Paenibacillus sp. UMB4589-SE434]MDK8183530.1 class I SAM-dependent methyltransferase [Paenibacillus sp. UMB4589-SE434]